MRSLLAIGLVLVVVSGCAPGPYWTGPPARTGLPVIYQNPALLPFADHHCAWETVVDVVDDYFRIEREEPVRLIGDVLTAGRIDTFPTVGATIFEPWRRDSVGRQERWESTLQSIRRRAEVRVTPVAGGYEVEVVVLKELEDVLWPEHATAGAATFRYDDTLTRVVSPELGQDTNLGWIPQGRDTALEQQMLSDLQARCRHLPTGTLPLVQ